VVFQLRLLTSWEVEKWKQLHLYYITANLLYTSVAKMKWYYVAFL